MAVMEWSDKLDIGVEKMNDQHKNLLSIMNCLHDAFEAKKPFETQQSLLAELGAATVAHFSEEEAYMEKIEFSGITVHKAIHADLLASFSEHQEIAQNSQALDEKLFTFLRLWLTAHIMSIDVKYTVRALDIAG